MTGGAGGGGGGGYPSSNQRAAHSYGHVYGGGYEDDYSISQHQARTGSTSRPTGAQSSSSGNAI